MTSYTLSVSVPSNAPVGTGSISVVDRLAGQAECRMNGYNTIAAERDETI